MKSAYPFGSLIQTGPSYRYCLVSSYTQTMGHVPEGKGKGITLVRYRSGPPEATGNVQMELVAELDLAPNPAYMAIIPASGPPFPFTHYAVVIGECVDTPCEEDFVFLVGIVLPTSPSSKASLQLIDTIRSLGVSGCYCASQLESREHNPLTGAVTTRHRLFFAHYVSSNITTAVLEEVSAAAPGLCPLLPWGGGSPAFPSAAPNVPHGSAPTVPGSVRFLPIDGNLTLPVGSGPRTDRQTESHAHSCVAHRATGLVYVCDLGADRVYSLRATPCLPPGGGPDRPDGGALSLVGCLTLQPADGPRHIVFSACGRFGYILCELSCDVVVVAVAPSGTLMPLQRVATVAPAPTADNPGPTGAHITLDQSGSLLLASIRRADKLATFRVCSRTGLLAPLSLESSVGVEPRAFAVDEHACAGGLVLVAGQNDHSLTALCPIQPLHLRGRLVAGTIPMPSPSFVAVLQ